MVKEALTTAQSIEKAKTDFVEFAPQFGALSVRERSDLTQREIDVLAVEIRTAKDIKSELVKAVDARTEEVRGAFYRYANNALGGEDAGDKPFVAYSPDHSLKMVREMADIGGGVDGEKLLASLYEHFGEKVGSTDGRAWKVWEKVSDPIQKRVLNAGKLEAELTSALEHEAGVKHGSKTNYLPVEVVSAATIPSTKQARFNVKPMTKDEVKAHEAGELL
jgi:hypothetical protein